jgi:hypothetical protein
MLDGALVSSLGLLVIYGVFLRGSIFKITFLQEGSMAGYSLALDAASECEKA